MDETTLAELLARMTETLEASNALHAQTAERLTALEDTTGRPLPMPAAKQERKQARD